MSKTETRIEKADAKAPVVMEKLSGGRGIVLVGDIVTPRLKSAEHWDEYRVTEITPNRDNPTSDWAVLSLKAPDGKTDVARSGGMLLTSSSELQARAQLESVREMVAAIQEAILQATERQNGEREGEDDGSIEKTREAIQQDALSVEVRGGWSNLSDSNSEENRAEPAEFKILLCTGGPAVQIIGELEDGQPTAPRLQHQDWGTPWADYPLTDDDRAALVAYASEFCFE